MDPSTPAAQDVQNQTPADQPVNQAQQATSVPPDNTAQPASQPPLPKPQAPKHQISVGNIEAGSSVVEDGDEDDDDEELMVSPQETKNRMVLGQNEGEDEDETATVVAGQQGVADIQENVELQPSAPELSVTGSPEVEKVIERTADQEKPAIPKEVMDAGVTHSGPGVIMVEQQNNFGVTQMPISYQQAAVQIKKTKFKQSKHWLLGKIMYIWRKLQTKTSKEKMPEEDTQEENSIVLP